MLGWPENYSSNLCLVSHGRLATLNYFIQYALCRALGNCVVDEERNNSAQNSDNDATNA